MRLEANISLSTSEKLPNYKVELKNINSFKFLRKQLKQKLSVKLMRLTAARSWLKKLEAMTKKRKTTFSQRTKADSRRL